MDSPGMDQWEFFSGIVLCPWVRHFTPRKYWLLPRKRWLRPDMTEKIVDWDVKPQHKQTNLLWYANFQALFRLKLQNY